jgi:hypothetical protein
MVLDQMPRVAAAESWTIGWSAELLSHHVMTVANRAILPGGIETS